MLVKTLVIIALIVAGIGFFLLLALAGHYTRKSKGDGDSSALWIMGISNDDHHHGGHDGGHHGGDGGGGHGGH